MINQKITLKDLQEEVKKWEKNKPVDSKRQYIRHPKDFIGLFFTVLIIVISFFFMVANSLIRIAIFPVQFVFNNLMFVLASFSFRLCGKTFLRIRACKGLNQKENSTFWKFLYAFQKKFVTFTAILFFPFVRWKLRINNDDVGSLARIMEWVQDIAGAEGFWIENDYDIAIKKIVYCPIGLNKEIKGCPGLCEEFSCGIFNSYTNIFNKEIEVLPPLKTIHNGDDYCEIIFKRKEK